MKRVCISVILIGIFLLSGCRYFPQPREMGDMALLRTIGVDSAENGEVTLTASTGPRAKGIQGEQQSSLCLSAQGKSLSAALLEAQRKSDSYLFLGYVDQLVLGERALGELRTVLEWFASNEELSLGAKLWVVQENNAGTLIESGGDEGVEGRLSNLRKDGEWGLSTISRSAEETYIAMQETGCAYVPVLTILEEASEWENEGYAVLSQDGLVGFLKDQEARGLELLAEKPMVEILEVPLSDQTVSIRVIQARLDCKPVFDSHGLEQMDVTSHIQVELVEQEKKLSQKEWEQVQNRVAIQVNQRLRQTLEQLKRWGTDCVGLRSRVALAAPWFWYTLREEWPALFSAVKVNTSTEVSLGFGKG